MAIWLNVRWFRSFVGVAVAVGVILTFADGARGQAVYELLHAFTQEGSNPTSSLIQASDGNFYGTTSRGGGSGSDTRGGTVFKITAAGTLTTLHSFDCGDGCEPQAGLLQASDGNFYGTTSRGGAGRGTVFKITASGTFTTLHSFNFTEGEGLSPFAGLIQATDGAFYGTTREGGVAGGGTVFKITASGTLTTLHSFDCSTDGCFPFGGGLIQARDGNFYGATSVGGAGGGGNGTVFKITPAGTLTTLHSFDCNTEGCAPSSGVIQASDGDFYGTTTQGGAASSGTVFKITPAGILTTLHSFDCSIEGCVPQAGLLQASDGSLYGTASFGGAVAGTVFKITPAGTFTTLHSFDCSDGCEPQAGLLQASDGNFYGTTNIGGVAGDGTVFKITAAGTFTTLHSFDSHSCSIEGRPEGCEPQAGLLQANDGNFYGTTSRGGAFGGGTVFKITAAGTLTTLHSFDCSTDGCFPFGGSLIQATDGDFYGTTSGTVFKITPAGILTTLHSFDCSTEGCQLFGGVIQASDGNFYGTTEGGGTAGRGTVFKITPAGTLTTLRSFDCNTEGCQPFGGVIQASDGNFYGTTTQGGAASSGTVFKITPAGILTTLHSFDCSIEGCVPQAGLIQANDGNFYGTTNIGGVAGLGTVFKITPSGTLTTLHSFDCGTEGCFAVAGLLQASDGNFYGTTLSGGVFRMTPAGTFTRLHSFACSAEGCQPFGRLLQASDGSLYGTASVAGPGGAGVVFRLVGGLSALSPARVWIGLRNSDDVGLKLDLLAEVLIDGAKVGEGRLANVSAGSSGFNNAVLRTLPLALTGGPMDFPVGASLEIKVSVRRTCSGAGHASGIVRLWYNGQPMDSGVGRNAGSRFAAISGGASADYFLRGGFALSTTPGQSRQSIDVSVDTKQPCPNRAFKSLGTWSNNR